MAVAQCKFGLRFGLQHHEKKQIYFFIFLKAGSPRSRCLQVSAKIFLFDLEMVVFSLCPHMILSLCRHVKNSPSSKDSSH